MMSAQVPAADTLTTIECQAAADSLQAASRNTMSWQVLIGCPSHAATAAGSAILAARIETDTTFLSALTTLATSIKAPVVLSSALTLSADKSASLQARIVAVEILLAQYENGIQLRRIGQSWTDIATVPRVSSCRMGGGSGQSYAIELPMPSTYPQQIAAQTEALRDDGSETAVLRGLARCVRTVLLPEVPEAIDSGAITLQYVCRTRFTVHNGNAKPVDLTFEVEGTDETGVISAPANGDLSFITVGVGATRLIFRNQVIRSVANTNLSCAP
jgi:hypothetical protein